MANSSTRKVGFVALTIILPLFIVAGGLVVWFTQLGADDALTTGPEIVDTVPEPED